ncbi:MAG: hypothetical protein ACREBU_25675, partial [Nitrososphaera sp.]
ELAMVDFGDRVFDVHRRYRDEWDKEQRQIYNLSVMVIFLPVFGIYWFCIGVLFSVILNHTKLIRLSGGNS